MSTARLDSRPWSRCVARSAARVLASFLLAASALANNGKVTITIGGANENAVGGGHVTLTTPGGNSHVVLGAGAPSAGVAFLIGAGIPNAIVNGNVISISPGDGITLEYTAGMFSNIKMQRAIRPPPPPPPPPPAPPRKVHNSFGPAGGSMTMDKDGNFHKEFHGTGFQTVGNVNFQQNDTLASINQAMYSALVAQSSSLPPGYYFQLENDGVSLVNGNGDPFDVEVSDTISYVQPGTTLGIDVAVNFADFALYAQPYSVSGSGGVFPIQGSGGGGTWPTALPPFELSSTVHVSTPTLSIDRVQLFGLTHTWVGDVQMVLWDPWGRGHNLVVRPGFTGSGFGNNGDFLGGTYEFVPSGGASLPSVGNVPPGSYATSSGPWPSGTNDIHDTPLGSITAPEGDWKLAIYDWESGDVGSFSGWTLEGNSGAGSGPLGYCTAGTSTNGCVPHISASANPSVTYATPCSLSVTSVEGQKNSILFYGVSNAGFVPNPWGTGSTSFLCVKAPTQRTFTQNTGGTAGACDGSLFVDWNAYQQANFGLLGQPWSAGDKVYAQAWYRDPPSAKTTSLSDAVELTYLP